MGTNYYWREDPCGECGRADELHICKSLVSFEGHFRWSDDTAEYHPWLTSWADWKAWMRSPQKPGHVRDEYGLVHETEDFIASVEATDKESRRRQYDWCQQHRVGYGVEGFGIGRRLYWLDADGFSFYGGEFS